MTTPTDLTRDTRAEALRMLRDQVATPVALPGEPGFERCMPWNVAATVAPATVVLATSPQDVSATVRFAATHGYTVTVQATGHGAVGVGQDTILVQTSAIKHCAVDVAHRTARVGAGARWQDVIDVASPYGLAPLCSSAPSVGVVGFLTGGVGPLVRTVGLSSDHVRAFDVVTGEGRLLRATPDENADLFWGFVVARPRSGSSPRSRSTCYRSRSSTAVPCISTVRMPLPCCTRGPIGLRACRRRSTRRSQCSSCHRCRVCPDRWPAG